MMIAGDVRRDETVWGVGDGCEATVCSMSPICLKEEEEEKMSASEKA
jgi:hypothetical protein